MKKRTIVGSMLTLAIAGVLVSAAALPSYAATTSDQTVTAGPYDDATLTNVVFTPSGSDVTVSFDAALAPGHTSATVGAVIDEATAGPTNTFTSGTVKYSYEFTGLSAASHEVDAYTSTTNGSVQGGDYVAEQVYTFPYTASAPNPCSGLLSRISSFIWNIIATWRVSFHY